MTQEHPDEIDVAVIADAIESCPLDEDVVEIDRAYGYSGIFPLVAGAIIVQDRNDMLRIMVAVATADADLGRKLAANVRSDSLGTRSVFYFPGIAFTGPLTRFDEKEVR